MGNRLNSEAARLLWNKNLSNKDDPWNTPGGWLNWSSRQSDVAMVETPYLGELNNLPHLWGLNGSRLRTVFAQS